MSDGNKVSATDSQAAQQLFQTAAQKTADKKASDSKTIGQDDFLTLLVKQLENQDPLNPMENQEFAVQLAQFSQLEQLTQIKDSLAQNNSPVGAMSSFLGHEVVLGTETGQLTSGKGPNLLVDLPEGVQSARVDLLNEQGGVVGSREVTDPAAGKQTLNISASGVPDGNYTFRVVAVNAAGAFQDIDYKMTGTVEGFVLSPEPMLIVDGKEVSMGDVTEVLDSGQAKQAS